MCTLEKANLGEDITGIKCDKCKRERLRLTGRHKNEYKIECQKRFFTIMIPEKTNESLISIMKERLEKSADKKIDKKNKNNKDKKDNDDIKENDEDDEDEE